MPPDTVATPHWTPSARELDDLELLLNGCFEPPLPGFVDQTDSRQPVPVTLVVGQPTADQATAAGALDLVDPEGAPLARMTITSTWSAGPQGVGLVGPVERRAHTEFGPFRRLHLSPAAVHETHAGDSLLAVVLFRPPTQGQLATIAEAATDRRRTPLLLACTGEGMPQGCSAPALVRVATAAAELLGGGTRVVAVPVADHGWTPSPGQTLSPNEWMLTSVASAYATSSVLLLERDAETPPPERILEIVRHDRPPRPEQGAVIFFTGLSGSGKSTLARALVDRILEQGERTVTSLDGDVVRHHLSKGLGFSREDRETNILRIGYVAAEISRHHGLAVCSPIAPFEATRLEVRRMVERAGGGFVLIHVSTPLAECERRDRKGLYAKARAGEIPDFTGISSPYEEPSDALKIDTTDRDIGECLEEILDALIAEGWLRR